MLTKNKETLKMLAYELPERFISYKLKPSTSFHERRRGMKAKCLALLVFVAAVLTFSFSSAEVPQMINYQGRLTDSAGAPLDTTVSMRFRIYADSTTSTYLWAETHSSVTVDEGLFNVLLGSGTAIPDSVFNGSTRYLGIKVGSDSEMTPRRSLVSVGYAFHSGSADTAQYAKVGASDGDWVIHGDTVHHFGHVGIGTASPTADLHVSGNLGDVQTDGLAIENTGTGGRKYILGVSHNGWALGGGKFFLYDVNAGGMAYRFLVDNQGRVGIGQSSPAYNLDVSGDIRATGSIYGTVDNADKLDGQHGSYYRNASNLNAGTVPEARLPQNAIDGSEIQDGSIANADISGSANISASKISGTAWTHSDDGYPPRCDYSANGGFLTTSGSYVTVTSVQITLPSSGYIFADGNAAAGDWNGSYQGMIALGFGSTSEDYYSERWFNIGSTQRMTVSTSRIKSMSAGTHTIYLRAKRSSGSGQVWFPRYSLSVIFIDNLGKDGEHPGDPVPDNRPVFGVGR
jgi:hypothetical protein